MDKTNIVGDGAVAYAGDIFGIIAKDLAGNNVTVRVFTTHEELF